MKILIPVFKLMTKLPFLKGIYESTGLYPKTNNSNNNYLSLQISFTQNDPFVRF